MPHFPFGFFQKKPEPAPLLLEISYHAPQESFASEVNDLPHTQSLGLLSLPSDVIGLIMKLLNKGDFVRFARACRRLHGVAFHHENNLFWNILHQDFTQLVSSSKFLNPIKNHDEVGVIVTKEAFIKKPEAFQNLLKATQEAVSAEKQKIAYGDRRNTLIKIFCVPGGDGIAMAIAFLIFSTLAFALSMYLLAKKHSFKAIFIPLIFALILESLAACCLLPKLLDDRYEKRQADWDNKLKVDGKKIVGTLNFLKKSLPKTDIESAVPNERAPLLLREMKTLTING